MDQSLASGFLMEVNERVDASRLLNLLGYATDKVQLMGDSVKGFCPIHRDTKFRSLVIDAPKRSFKCAMKTCPGHAGGTLVDLYALTRKIDPAVAASQLIHEMQLEVDPAWNERLTGSQLDEAQAALDVGDDTAAEAAAVAALSLHPGSVEARLLLARIYGIRNDTERACGEFAAAVDSLLEAERLPEAEQILNQAIETYPDSEDLFFLQVRTAELQGKTGTVVALLLDLAGARQAAGRSIDNIGLYQRLIELEPDKPEHRMQLAEIHESRRDMRTAAREMEKAARQLIKLKRGAEAIPILERVLKCEPQQNKLRLILAEELIKDGDFPRAKEQTFEVVNQQIERSEHLAAEKTVRRWLEIEPECIDAYETLARIFQEQERNAEAAAALKKAGEASGRAGGPEAALPYWFRMKYLQPEDVELRQELVEQLLALKQPQRAGFELLDLGEVFFTRGETAEAEASLTRAASIDESPSFKVQLADTLLSHGLTDSAVGMLQAAREEAEKAGDTALALEACERLCEVRPEDTDLAESRICLLWKNSSDSAPAASAEFLERLKEAGQADKIGPLLTFAAAHRVRVATPEVAGAYCLLFDEAVALEDLSAAGAYYEAFSGPLRRHSPQRLFDCAARLAEVEPRHEAARRDLAAVSLELGRNEQAAEAFLALASLQEERGDFEAAVGELDNAASAAPDRVDILRLKALAVENADGAAHAAPVWREYLARMRAAVSAEEAVGEFELYIERFPQDKAARRQLADLHADNGRREEAASAYRTLLLEAEDDDDMVEVLHLRECLLALDPNNPEMQSDLAVALLEAGDSAQAFESFRSAAYGFSQAGASAEAVKASRQALDLQPENIEVLEMLSDAGASEGDGEAQEEGLARLAAVFIKTASFDDALTRLRRLIELHPRKWNYRAQLCETLDLAGETQKGLIEWKSLAALLEDAKDPRAALDVYGRLCDRLAGEQEVLSRWHSLAEGPAGTSPDKVLATAAQAEAHLAAGDAEQAQRCMESLTALAPLAPAEASSRLLGLAGKLNDPIAAGAAYLAAANAYQAAGQPDEAADILVTALAADPANAIAREALADFYESTGRDGEAFEHRTALLRAELIEATSEVWNRRLAQLREAAAGDWRRRLAIVRVLLMGGGGESRAEAALELDSAAEAASAANDSRAVLEICDAAPSLAARSAIRFAKTDLLIAENRTDQAASWLRQCVELGLADGAAEDADESVKRWLEISPSNPEAIETSAAVQGRLGQTASAVESYMAAAAAWRADAQYGSSVRAIRAAAALADGDLKPRHLLWEVLLEAGEVDQAVSEMQSLAEACLRIGQEQEAIQLLERVLERRPEELAAVEAISGILYKREGFDAALPWFRQALLLQRRDGQPDDVAAAYERILELPDSSFEIRAEYADWLEETGQDEAAKRQFLVLAGYCRDDQKDLLRAIEYLGRASALVHSPEDAPVFEDLAALHLELKVPAFAAGALREAARLYDGGGKPQAAIQCARQALELSEGSQRIEDSALLGAMLSKGGKSEEGAGLLREALAMAEADPDIPTERRRELCSALLEADPADFSIAEKYLALLTARELPDCAVALSRRFNARGCPESRMKLLKLVKSMAPANLTVRQEMAQALEENGADLEELQTELFELCDMAARAGDSDMAAATLKKLEEHPNAALSPMFLAPLYSLIGDTESAVARYAAGAEALAEEELYEDAAEALKTAIELDASAVPAATVAVVVRRSGGAPRVRALAEQILESAIRARSRTRALVIATALLEHSDRTVCEDILKRIAAGAGAAFVVAVAGSHADWLEARQRSGEADALAEFITGLVPNSPDSWWLASQLHRKSGRSQPAADAAMKAARLFNEAGAVTEEESCYREALEQFPNDIPVLETLAFFYDREKRAGDALDVMRRLASLSAQAGNYTASVSWYRKVLAYAADDETAREQFAESLIRLKRLDEAAGQVMELARAKSKRGEDEKAEELYKRLLQIEPDNEQAAAYLLDKATKREDPAAIARYTISMASAKAESGALSQASQMLKNLLVRDPENLDALEKLSAFSHRAQDQSTFRSATISLGQKLIARKEYMSAIIHFEALLESSPGDLEVLQTLVECCLHEGMAERGADFGQQMLERAREHGDMRRVVMAANAVLAYDATRAAVRRDLAESLLCLNRIADAVAEWQRAAEEFVTDGDLFAAAECFRRITQISPDNLSAWKRLADILAFADQPEEAREAYLHLADVYASAGDATAAIAVLRRLGDLDPNDCLPHERTLQLQLAADRKNEAIEEILWLVRYHTKKRDLPAAERLVEQGMSIDPESLTLQQCRLEIVRGLGRTDELRLRMRELAERFKSAGEFKKAAQTLEQVLEMDASQTQVRRELGAVLLELGEAARAHEHFARLLKEVIAHSDPEEARDAAESIIRDNGDSAALRASLARVFTDHGMQEVGAKHYAVCAEKAAAEGNVDAQIEYLRLATKARPRWTDGLRQLGEACADSGDLAGSFETFGQLAELLMELKQIADATAAIRRQISLRPKEPLPRIRLAELYARIGDRENRAGALQALADLYISRGLTDEAVDVYRQLIELRPDDPEVLKRFIELFAQVGNELEIVDEYLRLADALTRKGAFVEATQTYEQILAIDRRNPVIREKFINFLQTHGQKGRALAEMRRLADTYIGRGNKASALNVLVNALAMSPRDAELCLRLAQAYEASGNMELSVQTYTRAASLLADTAPVRAIDLYTKILEKAPQNTELRRRLAEAYARSGEQSKAASQARLLAEVHASRGELEQAEAAYRLAAANKPESLTALRQSVQLHAHDPNLQYVDLVRYGDALMESGQTDEALDQYRKARSLNDDSPRIVQRCIDALCQIAPEREAVPDMLLLAEKYMMAADAPNARIVYDRVLRLDPSCANAKAGRDEAFKMELLSGAGSGTAASDHADQQPVRGARPPKKARVGMNDLLGAFDEPEAEKRASGGGGA